MCKVPSVVTLFGKEKIQRWSCIPAWLDSNPRKEHVTRESLFWKAAPSLRKSKGMHFSFQFLRNIGWLRNRGSWSGLALAQKLLMFSGLPKMN